MVGIRKNKGVNLKNESLQFPTRTQATKPMSENTQTAQKSLNTYQLASYGAPSMPLSMVSLPLAVYLTPVYADSAGFGLSLAFVGLMLALSRVFDGIT
jgi:hypothetical protein